MKYPKLLQKALKLAINKKPEIRNYKLAAVLSYKGEEFVGFSRAKTHPKQKKYGKNSESLCIHAEVECIIKAQRHFTNALDFSSAKLYIARVKSVSSVLPEVYVQGLAKPCTGCQKMIDDLKVGEIIFTLDETNKYETWTKK